MSENVYQSVMVALTYQAKLIQFNTAINALLPQFAKKKKKQIQQQNCLELIKKSATNARP